MDMSYVKMIRGSDKMNVFDFISTNKPNKIKFPNLTYREASYLNQILDIEEREKDLTDKKILTLAEIEKYKRIYRFLPHFYDVRL